MFLQTGVPSLNQQMEQTKRRQITIRIRIPRVSGLIEQRIRDLADNRQFSSKLLGSGWALLMTVFSTIVSAKDRPAISAHRRMEATNLVLPCNVLAEMC